MACGAFATGNNFAVALLSPLSVAWADKITAMSNSKGELYSNSHSGGMRFAPLSRVENFNSFGLGSFFSYQFGF